MSCRTLNLNLLLTLNPRLHTRIGELRPKFRLRNTVQRSRFLCSDSVQLNVSTYSGLFEKRNRSSPNASTLELPLLPFQVDEVRIYKKVVMVLENLTYTRYRLFLYYNHITD